MPTDWSNNGRICASLVKVNTNQGHVFFLWRRYCSRDNVLKNLLPWKTPGSCQCKFSFTGCILKWRRKKPSLQWIANHLQPRQDQLASSLWKETFEPLRKELKKDVLPRSVCQALVSSCSRYIWSMACANTCAWLPTAQLWKKQKTIINCFFFFRYYCYKWCFFKTSWSNFRV